MAGKNQYYRLIVIDKKLQTGRKFSWVTLANTCEEAIGIRQRPSKRTIQGDIAELRKRYQAPIPKRCLEGLWYYTDTSFSINNNPLFHQDVLVLRQVKNILDQFSGLTMTKSLEKIIQKLQANLDLPPISVPKIIHFDKLKTTSGSPYLEPLYSAILEKKVIELHYQPFTQPQPSKIIVHPYFIKQYNYRWFLIGWQSQKKKLQVYGLERIKSLKVLSFPFHKNESLQPENYFNDIIGVSIPDNIQIQKVHLEITPQRSPYILTKLFHPSQKTIKKLPSGSVIIQINVIPNFELMAQILSHGSGVKVLFPKSLVDSITKELQQAHQQY